MVEDSWRVLHASLKDYLLLLGEPSPLLGTVCLMTVEAVELLGKVPVQDSSRSFYKLSAVVLNAAIFGIIDRLEGLRPASDQHLQSVRNCLKVVETLPPYGRCDAYFRILNIALEGLSDVTGVEYPDLVDGKGQKLKEIS